jgi:DNA topoisomerase IA
MADQIVITEKNSQAKDVRAAIGSRYGDVLPAEGHLFDLLEPEDVVPAWKRWSPILLRPASDEKKLFDVIARAYIAALMPDFRYRQTTATLDVRGFDFRATGRQPIDLGWRAAFPEWQPADEKGDEAQLLPPLRNGETAQLQDPKIENKETRPPPRYNEGTLIEAMQNAWRFVDDEVLRDRLKEAKGIGNRRAEEAGFSDCPRKEYCSDRDRPVVVRCSQTSRSGASRSGGDRAT